MEERMLKRKICVDCKQSFSRSHYFTHIKSCKSTACYSSDGSDDDVTIGPNDQQEPPRLHDVFRREVPNLEEEDRVFFDVTDEHISDDTDEECDSDCDSYFDSDIDSVDGDLALAESDLDVLARFMGCFLLLWQSVYCVSDVALEHILRFIQVVFMCMGKVSQSCRYIAERIPRRLQILRAKFGTQSEYRKYVVCIKCKSLYNYNDCVEIVEGEKTSKLCPFVEFPNHSKAHLKRVCCQPLLKVSSTPDGKGGQRLIPYKQYYFQSVKSAIQNFVQRPGFEDKCEQWREREVGNGLIAEVYDGKIWKEFADPNKHNFLNHPNNYALMLNVDWFQPYKHVNYSVGAIYLVILNLPVEERFKQENVILVGLMPNFDKEPPTNSFLQPLMDELLQAWYEGFRLLSYSSQTVPKLFRLALICCGCDVPAARKVCGFLGHMANLGCHRCMKVFPGTVGEKSFGGFDRENWVLRNNDSHRKNVKFVKRSKTRTERNGLESKFGVRDSVLLQLPYFDPVRMTIIDPMHNLFLGTAKHVLRVWKEAELLTSKSFDEIQAKVDQFKCPTDLGNIPHKISSGFSCLTADQLKNWTLLFSMFALRNILPEQHLKCWQKFVLACSWLSTKVLNENYVRKADQMLLLFCKAFERLYGSEVITPNMHLHCHIAECILDFGPIYGFWLFSFERYNGILGNYPTNRKDIEAQLFKRFLNGVHLNGLGKDSTFGEDMQSVLKDMNQSHQQRGSLLSQSKSLSNIGIISMSSSTCVVREKQWDVPQSFMDTVRGKKIGDVSLVELVYLKAMYRCLYGSVVDDDFVVCPSYWETNTIYFMSHVLGSCKGRSKRSALISAHWSDGFGNVLSSDDIGSQPRPGKVQKYILHKVIVKGEVKLHVLAKVYWYLELPSQLKERIGELKPVQVWSDMTVDPGSAQFIPVQRIKNKAVAAEEQVRGRNVLFVCPRQRYLICE